MRAAEFAPGGGGAFSGFLLAALVLSAALDLADAFALPVSGFALAAALARGVDFEAAAGTDFFADGFCAAAALSLDGFFGSLAASALEEPMASMAAMATAVLAMRKRELVNGRSSLFVPMSVPRSILYPIRSIDKALIGGKCGNRESSRARRLAGSQKC